MSESRQFSSETPKVSSIISERSHPGVTATAVAPNGCELVSLRERQPVHRHLGQVVEHRDPVPRRVVLGGAVRHLDEQTARLVDEQGEKVMGRDEVGVDGEPEDAKTVVEIELPDRRVPVGRTAFEHLAAPDVVDEDVDVAVLPPDVVGEVLHLVGIEMVDDGRDAGAAEVA